MIITAWNMLTNRELYRDPGADYYTRHDPHQRKPAASNTSKPSDTTSPSNRYRMPDEPRTSTTAAPAATADEHVTNQDGHQLVVT